VIESGWLSVLAGKEGNRARLHPPARHRRNDSVCSNPETRIQCGTCTMGLLFLLPCEYRYICLNHALITYKYRYEVKAVMYGKDESEYLSGRSQNLFMRKVYMATTTKLNKPEKARARLTQRTPYSVINFSSDSFVPDINTHTQYKGQYLTSHRSPLTALSLSLTPY
jgi:hypothetical protein